ncbi:hypothetical protein Tco_1125989 [Tanacetum coccineum]
MTNQHYSGCQNLGGILEHEKATIETNIAHLDRVMAPVERHEPNMHEQDKMQIRKREMRGQIDSYWKDLKLPVSKRDQIETFFSRLCTEADTIMNTIMNSMKIQSHEKQSRLSISFYELATKVLQTIPAEVKKNLLDGSPSSTFTEVSYEEMRALKNAKSALNCLAELGEMLEQEKANIETNIAHVDQVRGTNGNGHEPNLQSNMGNQRLPAWFQSCATLKNTDRASCIKEIQSDEKQSHLSIYFHEVGMAAKPSF